MYIEAAFPGTIDRAFTYSVPDGMGANLHPGCRVLTPFGRNEIVGYVLRISEKPFYKDISKIKSIRAVLDEKPLLKPDIMKLAGWIAEYYLCPIADVYRAVLVSGINRNSLKYLFLTGDPDGIKLTKNEKRILEYFENNKITQVEYSALKKSLSGISTLPSRIKSLKEKGILEEKFVVREQFTEKNQLYAKSVLDHTQMEIMHDALSSSAPAQAKALKLIYDNELISIAELANRYGANRAAVSALKKKELIDVISLRKDRFNLEQYKKEKDEVYNLTSEQQAALIEINRQMKADTYGAFLLWGVTGSGKTEIYIRAMKECLAAGKSAIMLVPEIALTAQTIQRLKTHFGEDLALLHSKMSFGEKYDCWMNIYKGRHRVVVGTRSALFAPVDNLGLIVVDEEHETSFKQETDPKYHGRDTAVMRASFNNAVVVLAGATPALESLYNTRTGKYSLLQLKHRINKAYMPEIEMVDLKNEVNRTISSKLQREIQAVLDKKEQVMLLINRRGFSIDVVCGECGYHFACPECDVSLKYHKPGNKMLCHYCAHEQPRPSECPNCRSEDLLFLGSGTQKIEKELQEMFPGAVVDRMDTDSVSGKESHLKLLNRFSDGEINILLGTQMIAKGFDFPKVTLVGVLDADNLINIPDFRAEERAYQLLVQIAGRAGRSTLPGRVIIQSYEPNHKLLQYVKNYNYTGFIQKELEKRNNMFYPPFSKVIRFLFSSEDNALLQEELKRFYHGLSKNLREICTIYEPVPAPIEKLRNRYRWHIILKTKKMNAVKKIIKEIVLNYRMKNKVLISVDVDPQNFM